MNDLITSTTGGTVQPGTLRTRLRSALRKKLQDYDFTHFITLASNHQTLSRDRMRALLKEWDARVNRELNGPRWTKRPDERLLWFAFPEKMDVNPHWHLIAQLDPVIESEARQAQADRFVDIAEMHWLKLLPYATFDCQDVESAGVIRYITKMSADESNFENFVFHREFMNI